MIDYRVIRKLYIVIERTIAIFPLKNTIFVIIVSSSSTCIIIIMLNVYI